MYVKTAGMSAYRRRKGMGDVAGPLFTCPTGEQVFRTSDCPGGSPVPDVQQQIADIWSSMQGGPVAQIAPASTSTFTGWLNANGTMLAIGAAAFLGLIFVAKAGR